MRELSLKKKGGYTGSDDAVSVYAAHILQMGKKLRERDKCLQERVSRCTCHLFGGVLDEDECEYEYDDDDDDDNDPRREIHFSN